jgi:hypothetical protein
MLCKSEKICKELLNISTDSLDYKTYEGWQRKNFQVIKGSVAIKWDKKVNSLFSFEQIEPFDLYEDEDEYWSINY